MTDIDPRESVGVRRRVFLGGMSSAPMVLLAGCGNSETNNGDGISSSDNLSNKQSSTEREMMEGEVEKLESIYDALSDLPVENGEEFVFDVKHFENRFDHESLLKKASDIENQLRSVDLTSSSDSTIESLISIAETAKLLVQQRKVLHQVIAAGLTCEKRFYRVEFENATEAIVNARQFLVYLDTTGEQIVETIPEKTSDSELVEGYDPDAIKGTQDVLVDISLWSNPAYEGLHRASRGMELFVEGNIALERERYEVAEPTYYDAGYHFEEAQQSFEDAQVEGTRLPYLAPFVDDLRCILPAYVSSSSRLSESMRHFQAGEENRAKEIAEDAMESADQDASRCF